MILDYSLFLEDVSTTVILTPGPVVDFLLANQNIKEPRYIDWGKVEIISDFIESSCTVF